MDRYGIKWPWINKDITPWLYQGESLCWVLVCLWTLVSFLLLGCDWWLTTESRLTMFSVTQIAWVGGRTPGWSVQLALRPLVCWPHSWAGSRSPDGWASSRPCICTQPWPQPTSRGRDVFSFRGSQKRENPFFSQKPPGNFPFMFHQHKSAHMTFSEQSRWPRVALSLRPQSLQGGCVLEDSPFLC